MAVATEVDETAVGRVVLLVGEGTRGATVTEGAKTEVGAGFRPAATSVGVTPEVGLPHPDSERISTSVGRSAIVFFRNRNLPAPGGTPYQSRPLLSPERAIPLQCSVAQHPLLYARSQSRVDVEGEVVSRDSRTRWDHEWNTCRIKFLDRCAPLRWPYWTATHRRFWRSDGRRRATVATYGRAGGFSGWVSDR